MAFDYRNSTALAPVRTLFSIIAYPFQETVSLPARFYQDSSRFVASQADLSEENAKLKEQLQLYEVQYRNMEILEAENARLRDLLKTSQRKGYQFFMAEVLEAATDRVRHIVTLDKGSRDGVFEKQVVLAAGGYVYGQVVDVSPFSSTIIQLTDLRHAIPVRNQRTGERALAHGTGKPNQLELRSATATNEPVREGDVFLTSGLDRLFPADFPVAKVLPDGIEYVPGDPLVHIKAQSLVNFEDTREVLLVVPQNVVEPEPESDAVATEGEVGAEEQEASQQ